MKPDFSKYKGLIRENLQQNRKSKVFSKALPTGAIGAITEAKATAPQRKLTLSDPVTDHEFFDSLHALTGVAGKEPKYHQAPGLHPHFAAIKQTGGLEYHWIVSMFIDVQRSTKLFAKYEPFVVANIITTIQRAAIHIAWYFDSYVQRYHGDGLLLYFGGKGTDRKKAIENAILTASVFTKFVKEELPDIFLERGIEDIYTRIGIDVGEDEDTLWHLAGMQACSEVTTCSLHTSLAAHMQGSGETKWYHGGG
jgi:adenylate cyclase